MKSNIKLLLVFLFTVNTTMQNIRINILHQQRFHSAFPPEKDEQNRMRYGIARIINFVKREKDSGTPTLFFDTMDWAGGGLYYSIHRLKICADFLRLLPIDVLTLSCNEMGDGPESEREKNYRDYITAANKTVTIVNVDYTNAPAYEQIFQRSKIINQAGLTIGVTGYMTSALNAVLSLSIRITNESLAIQEMIDDFKSKNVDFIVLLSHGGRFLVDQKIISNTHGLDLVIGGHSESLFYNGNPPNNMRVDGEYPSLVKDAKGRDVMVVYSGNKGRYVGKLELTFDENRTLTNYSGNPVHMDHTVEEDPEALKLLEDFSKKVEEAKTTIVGQTRVVLNGSCFYRECNLGNLVVDSFVEYRAFKYEGKYWTDVAVGVINSNAIVGEIVPNPEKNNTFTLADIYDVLPWQNMLMTMKVKGTTLRKALEHAVSDLIMGPGKFLQVSGIRVQYDISRPPFQRVKWAEIRCQECVIPEYFPLSDDGVYNIITNRFLAEGGLGFYMFKNESLALTHEGISEVDSLKRYMDYYRDVAIGTEERILISEVDWKRSLSTAFIQRRQLFPCIICISTTFTMFYL